MCSTRSLGGSSRQQEKKGLTELLTVDDYSPDQELSSLNDPECLFSVSVDDMLDRKKA